MRYAATRCISSLLLVTYLSACTKWQVQNVTPEQTFADSFYVRKGVRVITVDSQRVEIKHPKLTGDTITGRSNSAAMVAIPLQNVRELDVRRPDSGRTLLLLAGSIVARNPESAEGCPGGRASNLVRGLACL